MPLDKTLLAGSTGMLILNLLSEKDMYGYQIIETLSEISENVFSLKAGTLYPLLHSLEGQGLVSSYEQSAGSARVRKYYSITPKGRSTLVDKKAEWETYTSAVNRVLKGGSIYAAAH